ncbi:MAG: A/G-specific adenine glycosylase [Anaerolineae bacterium]|nr:A/G-specific adenine glycosylase [Anaerolineae bacterium]
MPTSPRRRASDDSSRSNTAKGYPVAPPFAVDLLAWYDRLGIELPWRGERDPYRVWLSEIMLQQTQVETVKPYFARFLAAFPTVEALAAAPLDAVLKLWEGLGYYSRARNLHRAAQVVAQTGVFPSTPDALLNLPGVGRYTAGAIASIAFGVRAPVLDGNVIRVYVRLLDLADEVTLPATQEYLWEIAEAWLPADRPGDYNQAVMDLGRLVCTPRSPDCAACPLRRHCLAHAAGTQGERPIKAAKAAAPHYDVTAGLIRGDTGDLLIAQRPLEGLLGGLWEFPGGKVEPGETLPECLRRELREELGIEVAVGEFFVKVKHAFTHFRITLHAFECRHIAGEPQRLGVHAFAWVREDDLDAYSFGKADRQVIAALKARRNMLF